MRPCVDVILNDKVGRIEVLDDEVPPLLPPNESASPRLSDNLRQLPCGSERDESGRHRPEVRHPGIGGLFLQA